jgi:ATP synthase protein I
MSINNNNNNQHKEFTRALALLSQIAISIIACVAVGIFVGWFLDRLLGTSPWLLLVFTLVGAVAAFKSIFDFAKKV